LARARLTLSHAGLNTVLDSLSCGVPLVTVPITYEQPAIASRVRWCGVGEVVPFQKIEAGRLRRKLEHVLGHASYFENARLVRDSIDRAGGVKGAADIIEKIIR